MIKHVIFSCLLLGLQLISSLSLSAQSELINRKVACQFEGNAPTRFDEVQTVYGFSSTPEAEAAVNRILAVVHSNIKKARFIIRAADVPNAEAVVEGDKRLILYSADFMLKAGKTDNWVCIYILAHEIAHHVLGHTLMEGGSRPTEELDADEWAGSVLCDLGADLEQGQLAIKTLVKDGAPRPGSTHPPKSARLEAIAVGFANANCGAGGKKTDINPPKPTDTDGDGFADNQDDCPNEYGTLRGCKDSDEDGITDKEDNCKYEKGDAAHKGCPVVVVTDSDNDGVPDSGDECKYTKGLDKFAGCPDTDGDNIPDKDDNCPNEKGVANLKGCPEKKDLPEFVEMVKVQGGTFQMGSNDGESDEKPVHSVTLSSYYIGRTEVTQAQWREIMGTSPSYFKDCDNCPVESVSYDDIQTFLQKLNAKYPNKNYRLPTEAEWEFAARGGNNSNGYTYAGSSSDGSVAWNSGNADSKTHPVAQKTANELGIYDMSGNVREWCSDWYGTYSSGSQTDPKGASSGSYRVFRGDSWFVSATSCRVAGRYGSSPDGRGDYLGFRLSRTL